MLEFKERTLTAILGDYQKTREVAYRSWKKLNKDNISMNPHLNNERFNELMTDFIENPEMLVNSKSITKEMQLHGNYASRAFDEVLSVQRFMRPDKADSDKTRVAIKHMGTASTKASVTPAVAIATVRQVSRTTMCMNSALYTSGQKLAKKSRVTFRLSGSHNTQGRNSVATPNGQRSTMAKLSQNTRDEKSGSRSLPPDASWAWGNWVADIFDRKMRKACWP